VYLFFPVAGLAALPEAGPQAGLATVRNRAIRNPTVANLFNIAACLQEYEGVRLRVVA